MTNFNLFLVFSCTEEKRNFQRLPSLFLWRFSVRLRSNKVKNQHLVFLIVLTFCRFDAWKSVLEYGGDCMTEVRPGVTTHLISVTPSTDKCQQIRRFNSSCSFSKKAGFTTHSRSSFVWIIRLTWLYDSMYAWERAPELQYTFPEDFSFFQDCSVANSQYNSTSPADDGSPSPELSYANTLMIASNPSLMTQEDEDLALLEDLSQDESEHGNFIAHKRKYSSESTESGPNTTESESDDASFIEDLESEMLDTE